MNFLSMLEERSSKLAFVELLMDTEDELVMLRIRSKPGCVPCFPWTSVPGEYFIRVHSLPVTVFKNVLLSDLLETVSLCHSLQQKPDVSISSEVRVFFILFLRFFFIDT